MPDDDAFIDSIYEAGAMPELWPHVLEHFNRLSGSAGSVIFTVRSGVPRWTASRDFEEQIEGYIARGYMGRDRRTEMLVAQQHAGFLGELDVYAPEDWLNDPIRREYWEPQGYGWGVATHVAVPNGDTLVIHGDADAIVPIAGSGQRTHRAVRHSQLVTVSGAPHGLNVSHAQAFNDALLSFLTV